MNSDTEFLRSEYKKHQRMGYALAGGLNDLSQRAAVYFHLYEDSGGGNIFPLIAAHGALWAKGYFQKGMLAGKLLSLQYAYRPAKLINQYDSLKAFANAFRDINRRVCAEAYCAYHFTKQYGHTAFAEQMIPGPLLAALNQCHDARRNGVAFNQLERRALFEAFFRWEQETIVAPSVEQAMDEFTWPSVKWLAMRPRIEFAYFGKGVGLQFRDFSSKAERIERGLEAYELAEKVGYRSAERALSRYKIMPEPFFRDPHAYFQSAYNSADVA